MQLIRPTTNRMEGSRMGDLTNHISTECQLLWLSHKVVVPEELAEY